MILFATSVRGDAVRIWLLHRKGVTLLSSVNSVAIDCILTVLTLVLMIVCALPLMESRVPSLPGKLAFVALFALIVVGYASLFAVPWISACVSRFRFLARAMRLVEEISRFLVSWRGAVPVVVTAGAAVVLMNLIVHVLALGFGINLSLADSLIFCPPVFLVAAMPISIAGWGVRETAMFIALGLLGIDAQQAVVLSAIFGVILASALPGAFFFHMIFEKRIRA